MFTDRKSRAKLLGSQYLDDVIQQFRQLKDHTEKGMMQVSDDDFIKLLHPDGNSIAVLVKHLAGNMRSRWSDFLVSDGEKADRDRDTEFEHTQVDTRRRLMEKWEEGWAILFNTLASLEPDDMNKTIYIRSEPHSVVRAINRQLIHYSTHSGQIIMLSKYWAGDKWNTLSIPKGDSAIFNKKMVEKRSATD